MNIAALQYAAFNIRRIGRAGFKALDGRLFITKGFQKGKRKCLGIERLFGQLGDGFF